jgi:beta-hydroxylase
MKWVVVGFYVLSILHIHFRGRVRLPFRRQIFDHSSFMAPINIFMHKFSRVPNTPFTPLSEFPELARLQENWPIIRAEAESMLALKKIKAAEQNDDAGFNSFFKNGWKRFYLKCTTRATRRPSACARRPMHCCSRSRPSRPRCSPSCHPVAS